MAHLVFVAPPYLGHLNPMGALARELVRRGHRATYAGIADAEPLVTRDGSFGFAPVGKRSHPSGTLPKLVSRIQAASGLLGLPGVIRDVADQTEAYLRDLPPLLREIGADAIVCDGTEAAGGLVAEHLGLPVVTVANALPLMIPEPTVPPEFTPWRYDPSPWGVKRNQAGHRVADLLMGRLGRVIRDTAEEWRLGPRRTIASCLSPFAQISQIVPGLDYPRRELPEHFHYVGPIRDPAPGAPAGFALPPDDGRPLVYASLGTLFGGRIATFRRIAAAARAVDVRLVIAHGGRLGEREVAALPGASVHAFVPQDLVLADAKAAFLNCGLNTVMDALGRGVPIVALPIAFEQDAIAARFVHAGAGVRVGRWSRSARRLARALEQVLGAPSYREAAGRLAAEIGRGGGTLAAADIVEEVVRTGRPVTRADAARLRAA